MFVTFIANTVFAAHMGGCIKQLCVASEHECENLGEKHLFIFLLTIILR